MTLTLRYKFPIIVISMVILFIGSSFMIYHANQDILLKSLEGTLVGSMETLFVMLQTNYLVDTSHSAKANITNTILSLKFGQKGYAFCMSPEYIMLIHPKGAQGINIENTELGKLLAVPATIERSRKETVVLYYTWKNPGEKSPALKILAFRYFAPYNWIVGMTAYIDEFTSPSYFFIHKTGSVIFIIILFFNILFLIFISKRILSPILSLTEVVEKYGKGDLSARSKIQSKDEIGFLANKFNVMLDQLQEAQQKLIKKAEEKYLRFFENAIEGIFQSSPKGYFLIANPALAKMFGYKSPEELISCVTDIDHQLYVDNHHRKIIVKQIEENGTIKGFECRYYRKDRIIMWGSESSIAVRNDQGEILYYEGIIEDITDRKLLEAVLRDSKKRLASIIEFLPDATFVIDQNGTVIIWNRAIEEMTGMKSDDIVGKGNYEYAIPFYGFRRPLLIDHVCQPIEKLSDNYSFIKRDNDVLIAETVAQSKGTNRHFWAKATPLRDSSNNIIGFIEVIRDITEKKEIETQLVQAQKLEAIGTFAGGIAHDFNNLLMSIQGRISIMLSQIDHNHVHHKYLKEIENHVKSAADLTKKILGFAMRGKYEVKPCNINEVIRKSIDVFSHATRHIKICTSLQQNIWTVEVDKGQIEQALMNLFVNAWQAMPNGGELSLQTENVFSDDTHMALFEMKPGKYVRISVGDTGIGMDEKTLKQIFNPFFSTKEKGRSLGLGLSSVYGIIKNHNGIIKVNSKENKGTIFHIYLPASEKDIIQERTPPKTIQRGSDTILLVDDEENVLEVIRELLESIGYSVLSAKNGREAIETYKNHCDRIDLVMLDMIMPDMSGGDTYEALKQIKPDVKVLISSGYSLSGQAQELLDRGCNGFIQKPFNLYELSVKIREILSIKEPELPASTLIKNAKA